MQVAEARRSDTIVTADPNVATMRRDASRRLTTLADARRPHVWATLLSLVAVGLLGLVHLPHPFHGDKALFQLGGQVLADGGVLYVDFWDLKKPGIYLFHALAGRVFGFSEFGVHIFELGYLLVLSALLAFVATRWLEVRSLGALAPLTTVGLYYGVVSLWHLTQPAILAALPIFVCMWPASIPWRSPGARRAAFFASGIAAGGALAFKLALFPLPLAFWIMAAAAASDPDERRVHAWLDRVGMGVLGVLAVAVAASAYFWWHGALEAFVWSTFTFPAELWWGLGSELRWRLGSSAIWFAVSVLPLLPLVGLAFFGWRGARRELVTLQLFAWLVVGTLTILLEHYAWWPFDFLVLLVPVGMLALRGVDGAMRVMRSSQIPHLWVRRGARLLPILVIVALLPAFAEWRAKARPVVEAAEFGNLDWVPGYQRSIDPEYDRAWQQMAFLREPDALPGPIYVIGNPLYQLFSGRPQAIPVNGWAWETLSDERLALVAHELRAAEPAYMFVNRNFMHTVVPRAPGIITWIRLSYEPLVEDPNGTWYRHRRSPELQN